MGLIERFFTWLDARRDKKFQRQAALVQLQQQAAQATALGAIEALKAHTDLMRMWLQGFQNISLQSQVPFSSVVRDQDEYQEEVERLTKNVDGLAPWQAELDFGELMKDLQ